MDKRTLPHYEELLHEANDLLHASKNQYARTLLGRVTTCTDLADAAEIVKDIEKAHNELSISDEEYKALKSLHSFIVCDGNLKPTFPVMESTAIEVFRKRIWSTPDVSKVAQFRNIVTDMWTLDFITLEEYVELNNEVDRYIQYTLSNGGMK